MTSRSSWRGVHVGGREFVFDVGVELLRQERQVAEDVVEHVRLGRELHLVARAQVVGDQEDALGEFPVPVVGECVAHRCPFDAPACARGDALVEVRHRRDAVRVQFQQFQPALVFSAKMLEQVRLADAREQVRPDRVLRVRKNDLLIFSCIFPGGVDVFRCDIPCVSWSLIPVHVSPFMSYGSRTQITLRREYITALQGRQGRRQFPQDLLK